MKKCGAVLCAAVVAVSLASCGQGGTVTAVEPVSEIDAVAVLQNIRTTQYFTDEAVPQKDIEVIVQAGINAPSAMNSQPWHFSVITDAEVMQQISGGMGFGGCPQGSPEEEKVPSEGMTPPEGMENGWPEDGQPPESMAFPGGDMPEGMEFPGGDMPEGMAFPSGEMLEGMDFPEGQPPAGPGGGSMNKAGITDAPLVIVISCKGGSELDAGLACQNMSGTAQLLGYGSKILTSPTMALNGAGQGGYRELLGIPEGYSAVAVLLIGHEDSSADQSLDGYIGATARNSADDMVTYISAN